MEKAKIGVVGLGGRGNHHAGLIASFDNAEVIAVCDLYQDRVDSVSENVEKVCGKRPTGYLNYKEMFEKEEGKAKFHFVSGVYELKAEI